MERVRSAVINKNKRKKVRIIKLVTCLSVTVIAIIEAVFLSHVLTNKESNIIQVFAHIELDSNAILKNELLNAQNMNSYTIPKAEMVEKNNAPMIALTYDDGPHPVNTLKILETLEKYGAKATFFMVGENVVNNKEIPRKVIEQGSEIGTHTWNHANLNTLSSENITSQLTSSTNAIETSSGTSVKLFRPPYGNSNDAVKNVAKSQGKAIIIWSVDTEDWKSRDAKIVSEHVLNNVQSGDIVLMHDLYDSTAEASEIIVKELTKRGYKLVTVTELFENRGVPLNSGEKYYNCK